MSTHGCLVGPITLARGAVLRVENGRGLLVTLQQGNAWLTQEGDPNDVGLGPRQSFRLDRDGVTVLSARRDSVVELSRDAAPPPKLGARLATWRRVLAFAALTLGGYPQRPAR